MYIPYFTLRLLTLACYFLPFVFFLNTCDGGKIDKDAFNTNDALQNEAEKLKLQKEEFKSNFPKNDFEVAKTDSLINDYADTYIYSDNITNLKANFSEKIICPTPYSISGIGTILLYKNTLGKAMVSMSLFLTFITFVFWFFIRKKKLGIYVVGLNLLSVLIFQVICLASQVEMLYGLWVLLFLLSMQLLTEIQSRKNVIVNQ